MELRVELDNALEDGGGVTSAVGRILKIHDYECNMVAPFFDLTSSQVPKIDTWMLELRMEEFREQKEARIGVEDDIESDPGFLKKKRAPNEFWALPGAWKRT